MSPRILTHSAAPRARGYGAAVSDRRHGFVYAISGLLVLAANVVDAANRGSSVWNFVAIAVGTGLLFYGFSLIARTGGSAD